MLKYIGLIIAAAGVVLLMITLAKGKRNNIKEDAKELSLILSAGYVSEHKEAKRSESAIPYAPPVRIPQRKRSLSKEALDLLGTVEKEREAEQAEAVAAEKRGRRKGTEIVTISSTGTTEGPSDLPDLSDIDTGVLAERARKATGILSEGNNVKSTGVLSKNKATGVLTEKEASRSDKATGVLAPDKATGILTDDAPKRSKGGTGILTDDAPKRDKRGTDILTPEDSRVSKGKKGTSVLTKSSPSESRRKATGILTDDTPSGRRNGTDILAGNEASGKTKGTAVLIDEEDQRKTKGTAVLIDEEGSAASKKKGTSVLTEKDATGVLLEEGSGKGTGLLERSGESFGQN